MNSPIIERIEKNMLDYIQNPKKYCEKSPLSDEQRKAYNEIWQKTLDDAVKNGYTQSWVMDVFLLNKDKHMEEIARIIDRKMKKTKTVLDMVKSMKIFYS